MDILERIRMVMKMEQLNAAGFADRIGVQRSNVSHVLTGRNKPSLDFIEKMLVAFPRVNASWLISGHVRKEEEMPEKETHEKLPAGQEIKDSQSRRIVKVITFYEDFTFDEYRPG